MQKVRKERKIEREERRAKKGKLDSRDGIAGAESSTAQRSLPLMKDSQPPPDCFLWKQRIVRRMKVELYKRN